MLRRTQRVFNVKVATSAYLDVSIGDAPPRRVVIELFAKKTPLAAENFSKLCTGEMVLPAESPSSGVLNSSFSHTLKPQLHYKGSRFHRVHQRFLVQAGDVVNSSGHHQLSIFGETFDAPTETQASVFNARGLVGTAVSAPNMNGSQFFILTADKAPHLDGSCICFGKVVKGMDVIDEIERLSVNGLGQPKTPVTIVDCGV